MFFECTNDHIVTIREKYIPTFYRNNKSMYNFVKLLKDVNNIITGIRIGKFLKNSNVV